MTKNILLIGIAALFSATAMADNTKDLNKDTESVSIQQDNAAQQPVEVQHLSQPQQPVQAQQPAQAKKSRVSLGGYGEVALSRMFYSDNTSRYALPDQYKNAPGHGRFDIPHAVIYLGYDFGKGWTFSTEIEFEHGGTGSAYEKEAEEGGEWESETEKGGEVELEQFYIQKSFAPYANVRIGHLVVPVGLNNSAHEPLNFFTVYRPEGENTILPSTWHQTGISFWGRTKHWRYEAQLLAGLNSDNFQTSTWINGGTASPVEFEVATKYGASLRIDNYTIPGLRLGLSGYYGHSTGNSYPAEENDVKYKGQTIVGSFDFTYNAHNWIIRGQADYGYLGDTDILLDEYNRLNKKSPYHHTTRVGKNAYAIGIEAGYDIFSQIAKRHNEGEKMYLFARYDKYSPCADSKTSTSYDYLNVNRIAVGINYMPMKQIVVKLDYSQRFLKSPYNNEPSLNIGIAYQGWFL